MYMCGKCTHTEHDRRRIDGGTTEPSHQCPASASSRTAPAMSGKLLVCLSAWLSTSHAEVTAIRQCSFVVHGESPFNRYPEPLCNMHQSPCGKLLQRSSIGTHSC